MIRAAGITQKSVAGHDVADPATVQRNQSSGLNPGGISYENQPSFNRNRLYTSLENLIPKHHDRSRGGSVSDATTLRDELSGATLAGMAEMVLRIESILSKELEKTGNDDAWMFGFRYCRSGMTQVQFRVSAANLKLGEPEPKGLRMVFLSGTLLQAIYG